MRFFWISVTTVVLGAAWARGDSPLPIWNIKERLALEEAGYFPGAVLLTHVALPDAPEISKLEPLNVEAPRPEEIINDFLVVPLIDTKFLPAYFAERPKKFLIDPQNLLSSSEQKTCLELLDQHASDSFVNLYVYVIGGDQEIPSDIRSEELIERFFSEGKYAMVVYYYMGAPQRSVLNMSPLMMDRLTLPEQRRALESSVLQALEKTNSFEQLDKFLEQISIRIYWMERVLTGEPIVTNAPPVRAPVEKAKKQPSERLLLMQEIAQRVGLPVGILTLAFLVGAIAARWFRSRARYRFPEFEVESRLGGSHAAGIGAVISFASASVPPASQRDQMPDYMRRA